MALCIPPAPVLLLACTVLPSFGEALLSSVDLKQVVREINAAEVQRESEVGTVTCTRRYTLRNERWNNDAVMRVRISSDTRSGSKRYEILSMSADGIPKKVFTKLLEAEMETSDKQGSDRETSVTSANYDFEMVGSEVLSGKRYLVLRLKPKRSSKYLIAGRAWVDPEEHAVVRVEGQPAHNISFWIGKPQINQSFRKVHNVWVSDKNRSVSDVRFLGRTELTVEFDEYEIVRIAREVARNSIRYSF